MRRWFVDCLSQGAVLGRHRYINVHRGVVDGSVTNTQSGFAVGIYRSKEVDRKQRQFGGSAGVVML